MYKGIFIHVPKAAGTSMMTAFEPYQEEGLITEKTSFLQHPMLPLPLLAMFNFDISRAEVMKSVIGSVRWDETFKFCFVRNPWDRYISNWHWLTRTGQRTGWVDRGWQGEDGNVSFHDFVHQIGACYDMPINQYQHDKWHMRNQIEHISDRSGTLMVDFVGRVENIVEDFAYACQEMGVPDIELPHLNHVGYHAGEDIKPEPHYSTYYTSELRDIVASRCKADIEAFGYTYEEKSDE
tara:strand:- start:301 stop:1011 length:711 start_codon:yes stop_codon:yes gene_type:complete